MDPTRLAPTERAARAERTEPLSQAPARDRPGLAPEPAQPPAAEPHAESHADPADDRPWTRRGLLRGALVAAAGLGVPRVLRAAPPSRTASPSTAETAPSGAPATADPSRSARTARTTGAELSTRTRERLASSGFVYVSPLRSDGSESHCHGEVWFAWLEGDVVLITARTSWKARAVSRGLDRARIWVGDHGRWDGWLGKNESFRRAPSFEARARVASDAALLERLMERYAEKYPDEFPDWEERMRSGFASGERILLRYSPRPVA